MISAMPRSPRQPKPQTIGELIRSRRETQGLTMPQLAELVGGTKGMVHDWESGRRRPKAKSLVALARVLELSTAELTAVGVDVVHETPSLPAMLRSEYDLPPEAIEQVERYVQRIARKHATPERSSSKQERRNS